MAEKVLFVDDDPVLLQAIRRSLDESYDIQIALSGAEALRILADEGPFACVVSDMKMPHMDGVELVLRIKQAWQELAPPCIILTGNQDEASASRARDIAKVNRFLNKPCARAELTEAIEASIHSISESRSTPVISQ